MFLKNRNINSKLVITYTEEIIRKTGTSFITAWIWLPMFLTTVLIKLEMG